MKKTYIQTSVELDEVLPALKSSSALYVDLEFDKNHYHFGFNLCLIQINDGSTNYLIDPKSIENLVPVYNLFEDETILKVCYAFGEDIRLLQYLNCFPKRLYDIAIARSIANLPQVSLDTALGIKNQKEKSQQKSNWCARPLSEKQLEYAAEDVHYLPELYKTIDEELLALGRKEWLLQEMMFFTNRIYENNLDPATNYQKYRKEMNAVQWSRLTKLLNIVDKHAAIINRPAYRVLRKDLLLKFAKVEIKEPARISRKIHRLVDRKAFEEDLMTMENAIKNEINNKLIHASESARIQLSKTEKIRLSQIRNRNTAWTNEFFRPIKTNIEREYGGNFANFLLSNRKIQLFCNENPILPYQAEILKSTAQKLNLTIPPIKGLIDAL